MKKKVSEAFMAFNVEVPNHVKIAKDAGASKEEIIHAVLVGLPPAGHRVTQFLPLIIESYDEE